MPNKPAELMVEQDLRFQSFVWRIQRFGWIAMAALLVLAALGFAGGMGPVNKATATNGRLEVEYKPYIRRSAPIELNLKLSGHSETTKVLIDEEYLSEFDIQRIVPQPESVTVSNRQLEYEFATRTTSNSIEVSFLLKAKEDSVGRIEGLIYQSADKPIKVTQVVYP